MHQPPTATAAMWQVTQDIRKSASLLFILFHTFHTFLNLNFFVSHGTEDVVLPIELGRMGDEFLKSLNINFEYHEYRSGHGIVPQNYYDLMDWIKRF